MDTESINQLEKMRELHEVLLDAEKDRSSCMTVSEVTDKMREAMQEVLHGE